MSVNKLIDFIYENWYKWVEFVKEKGYYLIKRFVLFCFVLKKKRFVVACKQIFRKKITDPQSFLRKKNTKLIKQ